MLQYPYVIKKDLTKKTKCSNKGLGSDPLRGHPKQCFCQKYNTDEIDDSFKWTSPELENFKEKQF